MRINYYKQMNHFSDEKDYSDSYLYFSCAIYLFAVYNFLVYVVSLNLHFDYLFIYFIMNIGNIIKSSYTLRTTRDTHPLYNFMWF